MKRYYNSTTKEWYTEGQSMTRRVDNGVFSGIPSEEQLYEWGFREWVEPAPTPEQLLERAKASKVAELEAYDASDAVNEFSVVTPQGTVTDWLDTQKRGNAQRAIDAAKKTGVQQLDYVVGGVPVTLTTDDADMKLSQLEMYAVTCTAVTERHKATINALESVESVEAYDYTTGYPKKKVFELSNE